MVYLTLRGSLSFIVLRKSHTKLERSHLIKVGGGLMLRESISTKLARS